MTSSLTSWQSRSLGEGLIESAVNVVGSYPWICPRRIGIGS
jgi:hypothetical protein